VTELFQSRVEQSPRTRHLYTFRGCLPVPSENSSVQTLPHLVGRQSFSLLAYLAYLITYSQYRDLCVQYGVEHNILFNVRKSLYAVVGKKKPEFVISPCLYQSPLPRVDVFKYLGVYFRVEDVLKVDCGVIKRKFYSACNMLFQQTKYCSEPVKLQLVKSI